MPTNKSNQNGFSMIELLVAVTLISVTLLGVGVLSSLTANGLALVQRKREAESLAREVTARLKAYAQTNLPQGGSFAVLPASGLPVRNSSGEMELNCNLSYCDRIIVFPAETEGTTPRQQVISWDDPMPENANLKFIRAWTISDEDAVRHWRRISVAILTPNSTVPVTFSVTGGVIK